MITVIFTSIDNKILYSMICKNKDNFIKLEAELYTAYPEYSNQYNYFLSNGVKIDKYISLEQNNIHNSGVIVLNYISSFL